MHKILRYRGDRYNFLKLNLFPENLNLFSNAIMYSSLIMKKKRFNLLYLLILNQN